MLNVFDEEITKNEEIFKLTLITEPCQCIIKNYVDTLEDELSLG